MYDEQDRKYFYEEFKKNGYQVGSYDDFKKDLNNKEDRDWYYNEAKSMGYDVGSSQDFDNMVLEPTPSSSTSQAAPSSTSVPTSGQPVASGQQPQTLPTQQQTVQQKPVNAPVATNQVEQPSSEEGKTGLISQAMGMIPKGVQTSNGTLQPSPSIPQSVVEGNQQEEVATPTRQVKPDVVTNDTSNDIVAKYGNYLSQGGDVDALQQTASDLLADGRAKTPEEAIEMAKQGLFGTADILAKQTTNQFVSSLDANNSGMVDNAIDAQWYSHGVQDKLKDEATRMGISYDDYIAHFVKPAMVESLVEKYGSNYRKIAEDVATRLYAHEGDVDSQLEQNDNYNDAASIINQFIKKPVADAINKAEAEANSYLQKYNKTYSGFYSVDEASPQTATAMGEYNKMRDPQKVLNSLTKQLSGIVDDPDFTLALVKVMDKRGYSYDKIDDFVKTYVKPMLNASIKGELDRLEMKKLIPHNSFEYIMKTGLGNTIVGKVSRKLMQTDYQNWLEDMANQQYQPGFWENVASGALTFAGDAWSYWLPGAAGGKLTKAMLAKAEGKLAGDLMAKGMERKMAERAAKMLVGRSKTTALKTGAAHGAVTFGGQSAISTPINEVYRDGQFDENGKPYHTSVEKVLAKTIGEVTKGAALGTIMQGGTLANMIGKGRGLAANILADVGGKAVDSSIMTGQALIEHMAQDPNFKPTGKDAAESFLESMANLTAIGLPGMMGKYAHFKDAREFNRKYDFNDEDLAQLRRFGYDDLRTAFEDLGINGNSINGDAELMGQLTKKYMDLMSDKSVPEVLKAKMMAVVEGKRPQSFSPVIDSIIVQPMDGKVYLETLNKDGGIIDRKSFSSYDEAKKAEKSLDYEKSLNLTSAYENAYHTDALQEHLDDVYAKAREKYGMGEGLTDEDKAAIYLHQNANAIGDIMQKQQSGMELTEQEQQLLNGYRHFYDSAFENSSIMRDYVRTFEDSQGVPHGTLREALEGDGKKRTEEQQKLVEAYQKQLYNDIVLKREMKQTVDDLYRQSHSEGQKQIGKSGVTAEGENPTETTPQTTPVEENGQKIAENNRNIAENSQEVASGVPPTEPPTTPPTPPSSSVGGETPSVSDAYKRGQDAVANNDSETLTAIYHADDVAEARLQRAFKGSDTLLQTIYKAIDEGKDMEQFIAQKANMLDEVQRDAIRKYVEASQAKQGVLDGIEHADDGYSEALTQQLWPYATEDGNIVPVTLMDGTTAFLKKANEYGGTFVTTTDENGQPVMKQVHATEIKETGNPVPFQDYVRKLSEQNHAATVQKFTSLFDGSNMQPGQSVEIAMEAGTDAVQVQFAGYTKDGRVVFSDGKDQIALSKDKFAQMRNNALQASINAELDAEEAQRANDAVVKAETEKKQRFADGIVGYGDGQIDYSSKESDPKVVAEYLQDEYGEDHGKLLSLINGSRSDIKEQLDNKRKQSAEYKAWLDTNADLDPDKERKVEDELKLVQEQMDDLSIRYKNWNTIRNSVMTPDEIRAMKDERTKTIKDVGVDESAIAPSDEREVSVLSNDELKKQYPTLDEASNHIASERKRIYDLQSNEVQPQIDGIKDVLEQYKNGEIELEPEQIKEINTTKAQLEARQQGLTDSAKELKAQAGKLNRLYKDELDAEGMSNLGMTPSEQRREQVKKALAKGDMNAIAQIYKDAPTDVTDLTPQTLEEAISERLPVHGVNAESLQQELGKDNFKYGIGKGYDSNKFNYLLAKKGEGETVASISKRVWENLPPNLENMGYTDQDVRNALLDMFKTYDSVKDMMNVALINRIAQAENELSTEEEYYEAQKDREIIERQAEIEAFDSFIQDKAVSLPSESELNNIYGMEYDQIMFEQERENQYKDYVKSILPELSEYDDRRTEAENAGGGGLDSDTARRGVVEGSSQGEEAGRREVSDKSSPETTSNQVSERRPETGSVESSEGTVDRTSHLPQEASFGERLKNAIAETETEPTEAQKKAGNYKKGHLKFGGYDFTVETPKGVTRSGKDENGKPWSVTMHDTYGYVLGKIGVDGDHIDMFINDAADLDTFDGNVFVIDQVNPKTGEFDEHKVMYGYPSEEDAKNAYLQNYSPGWKGLGEVTSVPKATFDKWLQSSDRKTKPFANYAMVKSEVKPKAASIIKGEKWNATGEPEKYRGRVKKHAESHDVVWTIGKNRYGSTTAERDMIETLLEDYKSGVPLWNAYEKGEIILSPNEAAIIKAVIKENENQQPRIRFSKVSDEQAQLDADYLDAVNRGDMEKAQKMVNEAAEAAGYSTDSSYQGTSAFNGSAPWGNGYFLTKEERKEAWDNDEYDGDQTLGDYIHRGIDAMNLDFIALDPRNYRAADPMRKEAIDNVRNAIQKKSETITMYRSVPSDVKEGSFRNGDWVTPSRAYAVDNAKVHGWGDNFNIIEQKVPVDEIWWDGNDIAEWGYGREEDYANDTDFAYKNTKNNRKLLDAVTYDDKGNVIPLSQRFNSRKSDERYQKGSSALKPTRQEEVLRDAVIDKLREGGMDVITDVEEGQRVIEMENGVRMSAKKKRALETASLGANPRSLTAISSADGAKILKNLDSLVKNLENSPTQPKTFIGEMADALGIDMKDKSSKYATFECKNGNVVTVRVSDHNATVSNLDTNGQSDAISVVVTNKDNKGITNDGDAHIVEFYYNAIKLRKAEGKPLADIANSIKQALYSGEFKDTTGLAEKQEVNANYIREQRVYHGSGADFSEFDFNHMGEGAGSQTFGWGGYVTSSEKIGKSYATLMDNDPSMAYYRIQRSNGTRFAKKYPTLESFLHGDKQIAMNDKFTEQEKIDYYNEMKKLAEPYHNLYEVDIPEDNGTNYLDWDASIPSSINKDNIIKDILDNIQKQEGEKEDWELESLENDINDSLEWANNGEELYKAISLYLGDKTASKLLASLGYTGIKYKAGRNFGGAEEGDTNYVIFKPEDMQIKNHVKFFRTPNGEAYGYTVDGKIYIDPRIANSETPIHEYAHLWAEAVRSENPKEWENIVNLMKGLKPVWDKVKKEYPHLESDSDLADEVLAQYSGKRGAERLRKEYDAIVDGDGSITEKAKAMYALQRLKKVLAKFWKKVADFLHIHFTTAEEVADRVMKDLLDGIDPREAAKAAKASRDADKTMFGMHNISLDKLRKAIKQGGFAAPSMGVIDSKNGIYSGYGEITLIPKAEKIAKRTGKNIGTYAADAWTPIYPPVEKKFGGNGGDVAYDDIESVPKEMQSLTRNAINSFMDGRDTNSLAYLYLHEKGKAPELVHVEGKYPKELHDEVKGILGKLNGIYNTTDEQKEKLLDLFIREVYDGNKEEFDNDIKKFIKKDEEFIKKRPNSNISKDKQLDVDWMKEHGYDYGALSRFVDGILRDAETSGKVDENATMKAAQQYIQDKGMKEDFDSWKEKLNDRYQVEEVIFAGYKDDGNRKYLPNTVENAVKVMKQDGKNASVGSASFSHFVASILKPMGTLDQIRKKKGNLTDNYEDVEKFQEKWQPVYDELADKMQPDAGPFESYGMDRLEEAATQKNPKKYAKDEYGVDLTDEDIDKLNELIDAVKNEKPSIYFETKFIRPYGLDEFEKAIVPKDTPKDVVDALKKAGIDVHTYDGKEEREKVTMDAINNSEGIRFMFAGEKGAAEADKAEEQTIRMDNLQVAKAMENNTLTPKAIKFATGWERGADGKWRYEIPDFKSEKPITVDKDINIVHVGPYAPYNEPLCKLSDLIDDKGLFDAYPSLKNVDVQMVGKTDLQGMYDNLHNNIALRTDMFTVEKKYSKPSNFKDIEVAKKKFMDAWTSFPDDTKSWADDAIDQFGGYTEDELKADELFNKIEKDMPEVAKVVRLLNAIPLEKGVKFLGTQISLNDYGKKVLAHEVQHAIQYIEGFAKGGNSNDVRKRIQKIIDENSEYADYAIQKMRTWTDFKKAAMNLGKFNTLIKSDNPFIKDKAIGYYWDAMNLLDSEEGSKLANDYDQLGDLNAKQIAETGYHVDEAVKELNRLADEVWKSIPEGNKEALGINNKLKDVLKNLSDDELYWNLAGEVEARNVMKRLDMTDEERRNSLASETEDIDRGDQIVLNNGGTSYSVVKDPKKIERLNKEKTFKMFSAMQDYKGELYSPMAAIIDGKRTDPARIGEWNQADERPDLVNDDGTFTLVKTDERGGKKNGMGDVDANYAPYMHTSSSMMNDQFTGAYARGNIRVVEWEIPESEKTSGYQAEKSKKKVGLTPWHSGPVNALLPKDRQRSVMLSRWRKAVRVVPDSEVAESIAMQLEGTDLVIPWNVVTPNQLRELVKLGVPITTVETGKQSPETKEKFLKQKEELEKEFPKKAKFVDLKMTQNDYKKWGKKAKKAKARLGDGMRNNGSVIGKDTLDVVKNVANTLGGAEANVYASVESVPEEYRADVERGAKGWYDPSNHTVHVYLPNCEDANDAQRTVFHEKVGHEGMEVLLGGEQGVRDFANFVYKSVDGDTRGKILDFANKYDPEWKNADRLNEATQEYIAHLAEDGPKTAKDFTLWTKMKHYLIKALKKLGIRVPGLLNDKDLRYYLMKAGKALHVWDNMSKDKQDAIMRQATGDDIKNALSDKGSGKPRMKKGESPIQYMKRVREWQRWKDAREDTNDPEPPQFYDIDKDVEGKKEWEQLNKDWRDRHGLVGDDMPSLPKREEGESDESFFPRYKEYEKWQNAINDKEDPMPDMFAWEKQKQVEATQRYEDWLTRHELNEQETADLDLYEGKVYPAETSPEAADLDKRVMDAMAEVTSTDVSKEGAARTVKHAVIHRRKNMEEASADDAIYINDIKRRIEGMAGSGVFDKLYSEYKGKSSKADALAEAIPYIIEAPRRIRDLAFDLNSTGVFAKGHIHITPKDVRDIQPYIDGFEELIGRFHYKTVKKGDEEKLVPEYDDVHAVSEQASKIAQAINENHKLDIGFVPLDGTDILTDQVKPLIAHTKIVPKGIVYENLSEEMKSTLDAIHDWYNYTYDWLKDNHTLREDTGFTADYVNHIWDKEKSNPDAYKTYVENRQRTKSPNEKPRTISTLMEGIGLGLVPKTTDITKMMAYYSRSNIEAWANKTMLQEVSGLNVVERDENGDIISSDPILSSVAPFNLEQYKYFEVPGIGPVWVYNVSPKQVKVKNPITDKEHVLFSEASAGDRFGVVFDTYQSTPFWKFFDTAASSMKKLELGFSGFHAGALMEVYMVQNMIEFGPKKALANFMKYIFVDTMRTHQLPCFANPQDFQEAATHLVKFGATNDYAAADVQNMFDNWRDFAQKLQQKLEERGKIGTAVGIATIPFEVATQMVSMLNKGMDVALWDFLHDGLKLATYRMRADRTKERAKKYGWTDEQLSKALDEDGQFVNDMFGGQHWDIVGASQRTIRIAGRCLLSPDWNKSTTSHFLAITGFGSVWNEATFENFKNYYKNVWAATRGKGKLTPDDWGRLSRQLSALLCYGIGFMIFYEGFANAFNAAFRALDEEKERKKAEELRKTNPNYRSPYELAYPDGMKWYDYLMRGNSLGQQSKIFMGRYADGTEMYIRHGKQFREVPEYLFNHKGELEFPGPMVQRMIGKANPMVRMTLDDINYLSDFQASHADQEIQRKYGKTIGLLYKDALYWAPFLIPSQENKEFKAVDFFFPSSKGFSNWKAQDYFKNFILSGDMEGVFLTYQSCQRNGIDAEKQLQAAISSIKALESKEMQDGVTSLQIATQRFNEAKSVTEKRKMREKMRKFLSQSEYKAFTWQEAKDMVDAYQQGEDIKDLTKADDKYLMVANAEDVTEDWRIQSVKSSTKPYADRLAELKDSNSGKAQAFKETYARIFKARQAISRATSKMNRLKKKLGKENDKTTLQEIRAVRKELLKNLNGMEHVRKLE